MHSPSSFVTVVLLYIVKTFHVAFSLLFSPRRSAGSKLQVVPLSSWNLVADLSMFNMANIFFQSFLLPVSRVKQYSSSLSSSVSTTLTFVLSRRWAVKWFIYLQLKHLPNAGHLSRHFSCLFAQNLHVMNSFDLGFFGRLASGTRSAAGMQSLSSFKLGTFLPSFGGQFWLSFTRCTSPRSGSRVLL